VLERAKILLPSHRSDNYNVFAPDVSRILEKLAGSVYADSMTEAFDKLDDFLDSGIDITSALYGTPLALSEAHNLQTLSEAHKSTRRIPRTPSTTTPEWDATSDISSTLVGSETLASSVSSTNDAEHAYEGHPLEVLLCVCKALEQHMRLRIIIVRVLVKLVLDLALNAGDFQRFNLLETSLQMIGSVEASATSFLHDLFRDVPGYDIDMMVAGIRCDVQPQVSEICNHARWLQLSDVRFLVCIDDLTPAREAKELRAAKATERLSIIRQVHIDLLELAREPVPQDRTLDSMSPQMASSALSPEPVVPQETASLLFVPETPPISLRNSFASEDFSEAVAQTPGVCIDFGSVPPSSTIGYL
jgi:hypothetical protein